MTITATELSSSPFPLCRAEKSHEKEEEEEEFSVSKMVMTPFEWLTNYASLSHLLCPRFLFPQDDVNDDVDHDADEDKECIRSTTTIATTKRRRRRRRRRRKVLHMGCGSSTMGESLLLEQSNYDGVVNVDTDGEVLKRMCHRWEMLLLSLQNTNEQNRTNSNNDNNTKNSWGGLTLNSRDANNEREADIEVCKMVFDNNRQAKALLGTMEDLQSQLDWRYHRQEHHCSDEEVVAAEEKKDNHDDDDDEGGLIINAPKETTITMDDGKSMKWLQLNFKNESICFTENDNHDHHHGGGYYPPGYFDLVLDKSTLDCALCSDEAAVGLLCEVYRALNPNGCVYFCVSFHHVNFILPLLRDCPGVQWEVQHYVVKRDVDIPELIKRRVVKTDACCHKGCGTTQQQEIKEEKPIQRGQVHGVDDNLAGCSNVTSNDSASTATIAAEPPKPVWASGSFEPNDEYGKTVNVFICRRYDNINNNNTTSEAEQEGAEELLFEENKRRESEMKDNNINKNGQDVSKRPVVPSAVAIAASSSSGEERTRNKYELDRNAVRKHVHHINDLWYQTHNPMVTHKREEELRQHFYEALCAFYGGGPMGEKETGSNDDKRGEPFSGPFRVAVKEKDNTKRRQNSVKKDEISNEKECVLPLEMCYDILFTDAEREHLTFEYFLQDWNAFLESKQLHFPLVKKDGMTFDIALEFLKEMQ